MIESSLNFNKEKKTKYATKLNLVALMDIFTILVFFLLLNSGDSDRLESAEFVKLPDSSAGSAPHAELVIMIGKDKIWLDKDVVAEVKDIGSKKDQSVEKLEAALDVFKEKRGALSEYEKTNGLPVTIMGDESVTYSTLQTVMTTCRLKDFRDISLAVNRVAAHVFETAGDVATPSIEVGG